MGWVQKVPQPRNPSFQGSKPRILAISPHQSKRKKGKKKQFIVLMSL